jgi:hypothetical protein
VVLRPQFSVMRVPRTLLRDVLAKAYDKAVK